MQQRNDKQLPVAVQQRKTVEFEDEPPVNYEEPLAEQVYGMDAKKYLRWVHKPVKGIESVRMFHSEFWERMSFTYPAAVPGLWWPVITAGMAVMFYWYAWWWVGLWFLVGLLSWFPAEHLIHRCLFHAAPWNAFSQRAHFMFHAVHHLTPKDPFRLVMPPFISLNVALVGVPIGVLLFDMCRAGPFWCGFGLAYTFYDLVHYSIHHSSQRVLGFLGGKNARLGRLYQAVCTAHLKHHYSDERSNFGVTNTFVDSFMRTSSSSSKKSTPDVDSK